MRLTVNELKKKMNNLDENAEVFIERVEDVYFDKHGWETERIVFERDEKGNPIEYSDIFNASNAQGYINKLIIYAHI